KKGHKLYKQFTVFEREQQLNDFKIKIKDSGEKMEVVRTSETVVENKKMIILEKLVSEISANNNVLKDKKLDYANLVGFLLTERDKAYQNRPLISRFWSGKPKLVEDIDAVLNICQLTEEQRTFYKDTFNAQNENQTAKEHCNIPTLPL
ncbi:MAG: hypothetical protein WBE18_04205, partial [Gammaproteobacteria bacterium]